MRARQLRRPALVAHYFDSKSTSWRRTKSHQIHLILVSEAQAPLKDRVKSWPGLFERFPPTQTRSGVRHPPAVTEEFRGTHLLRDSVVQAINSVPAQLTDNDDDADIRVTSLAIGMLIGIVNQRTILKIESLSTMDAGDPCAPQGPLSISSPNFAPTNQPPEN
jgi:hypothetical protein